MKKVAAFKIFFWILVLYLPISHYFFSDKVFKNDSGIVLTEVSKEMGVDFLHQMKMHPDFKSLKGVSHVLPWFEATSSSVGVVDLNKDGWMDLFLPSAASGGSKFFQNKNGKGFEDKTADYGFNNLPWIIRGIFFDCDRDGQKELLVTSRACPEIYKFDQDHKLYLFKKISPGPHCDFSTALNVFDFDKDGNLDFVLGNFYRDKLNNSLVSADNGSSLTLFKNKGACVFEADKQQLKNVGATFSHAIGVVDLFNREKQDLWVASDFNEDRVFEQSLTESTYSAKPSSIKKTLSKSGMSVASAFLGGSEYPYVFVSHVHQPGYIIGGNTLWKYDQEQDGFVDHAPSLKLDKCGWAWGSQFLDLNNDSNLELIVANGFISDKRQSEDAWFRLRTHSQQPKFVASESKYWPSLKKVNLAGFQRDCVFVKSGKTYINISEEIGFDSAKLDGRGLAVADFNNDGRLDLVVSNQKQKAQLYMNRTAPIRNWIGFEVSGGQKNLNQIGAYIVVTTKDGSHLRRDLRPFGGYSSQSDPRLHFGLGSEKIDKIQVVWSDGVSENIKDYSLNSYNQISR